MELLGVQKMAASMTEKGLCGNQTLSTEEGLSANAQGSSEQCPARKGGPSCGGGGSARRATDENKSTKT